MTACCATCSTSTTPPTSACAANRGCCRVSAWTNWCSACQNFRIINAAYTYARPEGSRFNDGDRGAWYCALEIDTALAEISFHKAVEYQEIGRFDDSVSYQALLADVGAPVHDVRGGEAWQAGLDPGSYVASQKLAGELLELGSMGVIYPSVRRPGGTNLACFRPALVGNVRKGQAWRLTWAGSPIPAIDPI